MPRKKRSLAESKKDDSDYEDEDIGSQPPRKKSRRVAAKNKQKEQEEEKNLFNLATYEYETIAIVAPEKIKGSAKIASFDMDHTMLKPKGKNKFPKNRNDWKWLWDVVPNKLKQLHKNGYQIVIFTNQNGIGSGKQSLDAVAGKIIDLSIQLGIPILGFLSIQKDHWRKPNVTMWQYFEQHYNNSVKIDYKQSFYVGDAAGRPKAWRDKKTSKDFSCSDRKFAYNVGIDFHTPEPFFLGENENKTWKWLSLDVVQYQKKKQFNDQKTVIDDKKSWFHGTLPIANKNKFEMILMMGPPGCGKSTFAKKYLVPHGYVWINRDTLKTKKKCLDATKVALKGGKCVVVDNTNPNYSAREPFVDIAKMYQANVRLFRMNTEREIAEHLNLVRERSTKGDIKRIPRMVYNIFYKKVREDGEPDKAEEGFDDIVKIDFIPDFKDERQKKEFLQFT